MNDKNLPPNKPDLWRVMTADQWALLGWFFPVWMTAAGLFVSLFTPDKTRAYFEIAAVGLALGIPLLFWRVRLIFTAFEEWEEVQAVVIKVSSFKATYTLWLNYRYREQEYTVKVAAAHVHNAAEVVARPRLVLLVNPGNPRQVLVRDLFLR